MTSHAVMLPHNPQRLVLLGSTGLIGTQTLGVPFHLGEHVPRAAALATGGSCLELLARQAITWKVPILAITDGGEDLADRLRQALRSAVAQTGCPDRITTTLTGPDATTTTVQAAEPRAGNTVVNGITGSMELLLVLAILVSGARLALANRGSLIVGGVLVHQALTRPGRIIPVDSEHPATTQTLTCGRHKRGLISPIPSGHNKVRRLVLTASGDPFRGHSRVKLTGIGAAAALKHSIWDMGPVATINSSTLINRELELIEAHPLPNMTPERTDVIVHPQFVIHSMVEFTGGATIAQASPLDVRLPTALGLTWSERSDLLGLMTPNDWCEPISWTFELLDDAVFPAVDLTHNTVMASDIHPAILNTANEQIVAVFLTGGLERLDIVRIDVAVVGEHEGLTGPGFDDTLAVKT